MDAVRESDWEASENLIQALRTISEEIDRCDNELICEGCGNTLFAVETWDGMLLCEDCYEEAQ